jgi:Fe2+ or Zn2+ uptake regulation protein
VCTACGAIEDLEIDLRPAAAEVAASRGYADVHERLKYYGICPR